MDLNFEPRVATRSLLRGAQLEAGHPVRVGPRDATAFGASGASRPIRRASDGRVEKAVRPEASADCLVVLATDPRDEAVAEHLRGEIESLRREIASGESAGPAA